MWKIFFSIIGLCLLSTVGFFAYSKYGHEKTIPVRIATVSRGEIASLINVSGRVVGKELEVSYSDTAQVSIIYVNEGEIVKQGLPLIEFDSEEASLRLQKLESTLRMEKERVKNAERKLTNLRQLSDRGGKAGESVDDAQADWNIARLQLEIAESDVHLARLNLKNMKLLAPISGMVTKKLVQPWQRVRPLEPLLKIVNFDALEIEAKVDAADSPLITLDQGVEISSDAYPGKSWREKIIGVVPVVNESGGDNSGSTANTFDVHISLGSEVPRLLFNQQIDVRIQTAHTDNALKIPIGSLITENNETFVALEEQGVVRKIPVTLGIQGLTHVQVTQGLQEGQHIIITEGRIFKGGEIVRPQS